MLNEYRDILTPEELACALGISRKSAYQLLHNGIIGFKRIGKKYLVPKIRVELRALHCKTITAGCMSERSSQ